MSLDFYLEAMRPVCVFDTNITHNLTEMADKCGLYLPMWHPERMAHVKLAEDLIPYLKDGINELESEPTKYKKLNPANGWGDYDGLLRTAKRILNACITNPDATVRTST